MSGHVVKSMVWALVLMGSTAALGQSSPRFVVGEQTTYAVKLTTESVADRDVLMNPAAALTSLDGEQPKVVVVTTMVVRVDETALALSQGRYLVRYRFSHPKLEVIADGIPHKEASQAFRDGLTEELIVQADVRGRIQHVWTPLKFRNIQRALVRTVLGLLQTVLPEITTAKWSVIEERTSGRFRFDYVVEGSGSVRGVPGFFAQPYDWMFQSIATPLPEEATVIKRPMVEVPPPQWGGGVDISERKMPSGGVKISLVKGRRARLDGDETLVHWLGKRRVNKSQIQYQALVTERMELTPESLSKLRERLEPMATPRTAVSLWAPEVTYADRMFMARRLVGEKQLSELIGSLHRATRDSKYLKKSQLMLKRQFEAWALLHPADVTRIERLMATQEPTSPVFSILGAALSGAGTVPCQDALIRLVRERTKDTEVVVQLIAMLGSIDQATDKTASLLNELMGSSEPLLRSAAQLNLGRIARSLAKHDPDRSDEIGRRLTTRLRASSVDEERIYLLLALGNAGLASTLDAIKPFLNHPIEPMRRAAVGAVRWMPITSAEDILLAVMAREAEASVRLEAAESLEIRPLRAETLELQKVLIEKEGTSSIRLSMMKNLWRGRARIEGVGELVKRLSLEDKDEEVRAAAKKLLAE